MTRAGAGHHLGGQQTHHVQQSSHDDLGVVRSVDGGGHFVLFGSNYQDVFAFIVLILVLVFRPSGLLGERVGDRA